MLEKNRTYDLWKLGLAVRDRLPKGDVLYDLFRYNYFVRIWMAALIQEHCDPCSL